MPPLLQAYCFHLLQSNVDKTIKHVIDLAEMSDEELLLRARLGNTEAENALIQRFFGMRFYLSKSIIGTRPTVLDAWDINEAFFHAFVMAKSTYEFKGGRFLTLFKKIYENELRAAVRSRYRSGTLSTLSMDYVVDTSESGTTTLADSVASNTVMDDPRNFLNFTEMLRELKQLPPKIDPICLDLVELLREGYSLTEASQKLGMTYHVARYHLRRYRKWAMVTYKRIYGCDEDEIKEKGREFDEYFGLKAIDEDEN